MGDIDMEPQIDHTLDLRTFIKPFSLLKVTQVFRSAKKGEIIQILTENSKIKDDLFKILPSSSYHLIGITEDGSGCRILFRRT